MMYKIFKQRGLSLIELLVVISIIGLLSTILFASFDESRAQARDKARMASLKELQRAVEQYRAQSGRYPERGWCQGASVPVTNPNLFTGLNNTPDSGDFFACASTRPYIRDLTPVYIPKLPTDSRFENEVNRGFYYWTNAAGNEYKILIHNVAETILITDYTDPFARCPNACGVTPHCVLTDVGMSHTYAVYSPGAECR
jgi:prepilin-type N-terminal cleavage/methylation domain-containing protein